VLEAPFGAVPFWWAAGILLALVRRPDEDEPAPGPPVDLSRGSWSHPANR
jgi:hypothetical protein